MEHPNQDRVLLSVVFVTVASLVASITLTLMSSGQTPQGNRLIDATLSVFNMGCGSLFTLLTTRRVR